MMRAVRMIPAAALGAALITVTTPDAAEHGVLRLHYVQKPIGYERYAVVRDGEALTVTSDFDFTDRGGRVQLASTLRTKEIGRAHV